MSILSWLSTSRNRRRSPRRQPVNLVAYYWTGATPRPFPVLDISPYGAYIVAPFEFYPGTLLGIGFEDRAANATNGGGNRICVSGRVLRTAPDGFCLEFVFEDARARRRCRQFLSTLQWRDMNETKTE